MIADRDVLRVAAEADVDPRTVRSALSGKHQRSAATRAAIAHALRKLGFEQEAQTLEVSA